MAGTQYTVEQLERLRESPLVKKPDGLPSIEQWMDVPNDQNNNASGNAGNRRPRTSLRDGDAATGGTDRLTMNPMGQFGRRQSMQPGEEPVLGPPKFNFASATRAAKTGQSKEPSGIATADGENLGDRFGRSERGERWRDRDGDRNRDKGYTNGRRAAREDGDGWTNVKGRKSLGQEDFDRGFGRNGDRDRKDGDPDAGEAPPRRTGNRWGRRDENAKEGEGNRFGGAGQGGWRDRERNREREKDREWTRGAKEEDPEWMDTPVGKETKAHTQEDFQRWKEQMKAKDAPIEEKEEPKLDQDLSEGVLPTAIVSQPPLKAVLTPSALEPNMGTLFGNWGKDKTVETSTAEPVTSKAKPDKKSRFMTMFAKPEEPAVPASMFEAAPASPAPAAEHNADKEGFQRILQMLGGTSLGATQGAIPTNGTRQGGIPLDFAHQSPPPSETRELRAGPQQVPRTLEQQTLLENILAPRPSHPESRPSQQARFNSMSPDNALVERVGLPRPDSNRPGDEFPLQQPPSRNNNPQDSNSSVILSGRAREESSRDHEAKQRERDFLLTLMQQPRATPPQMVNQNLPRQAPENQNLPFFDQPRQQPPPSKGRGGLPPGFMEDPRMFENEMLMRREQERREQQLREQQLRELQQQEAMRNKNRGMPMGFPGHEDPAVAGLQRRNTAGEIPRQMTNMGIPSQPVPDLPYIGGRQPGMPLTPQDRPNVGPPPGFGGPMRQLPGIGGPGPQQQMGPGPSFSAGNTPLGHPPGFPPPNNMGGRGMFPGGPGGNGMQGPPQAYFPPPGYGPPMGMRGEDPRMMFEQQFAGPGPRQQGRPGPPNMY